MIQRMSDQGRIRFIEKEEVKNTPVEQKKTTKNKIVFVFIFSPLV